MDFKQWCKSNTDIQALSKAMKTSIPEQYIGFYLSKAFINDIEYQKQFDWLGMYTLDIYIPSLKLAIEYDGEFWHKENNKPDQQKNKLCHKHGITLIRIVESTTNTVQPKTKYCKIITYFYNKTYSNIGIPICKLCNLIHKVFGVSILIDVDIMRDMDKITSHIQLQYHKKTIAYKWPESIDYWYNNHSLFDVRQSQQRKEYKLKCPHCGRVYTLYMRYDYKRKSLRSCECEHKAIKENFQKVIDEYKTTNILPVFTESLESRRLYDYIVFRIKHCYFFNVSDVEIEMYNRLGFQTPIIGKNDNNC